jgi:hypothetical protein
MSLSRRRRATATIALTAVMVVAVGVGVPAVTGAQDPTPPVDYGSLWDRFPLEDPAPATPVAPEDPAAAPGDSSGGSDAPVVTVLAILGALGVVAIGIGAARRRRSRRRDLPAPATRPSEAPAAPGSSAPADTANGAAAPVPPAPPGDVPVAAMTGADPFYGDATCRAFASGLSDEVLDRAVILFSCLAQQGRVDAARLSSALGARSRDLGGLLLTPLKRQADRMSLPLPYEIAQTPASRRRVWHDEAGIARRMAQALRDEEDARGAEVDLDARLLDLSALADRLRDEPSDELVLSLADLEALIGDPLPESVRRRRWWSNRAEPLGHPQAASWMATGWRAYPELRQGQVRFRRADGAGRADPSAADPSRAAS